MAFPIFGIPGAKQMAALSDNYKTVAMDTRAYNKSGKPEGVEHYTMSHLMSDVEAVIKDLEVDSVTLVGHDWGGAISWRFAMHYPQLVNKLVICNLTHPKAMAPCCVTRRQSKRGILNTLPTFKRLDTKNGSRPRCLHVFRWVMPQTKCGSATSMRSPNPRSRACSTITGRPIAV